MTEQDRTARHLARHIELAEPEDGHDTVRFIGAPCPDCTVEPDASDDLACLVDAARAFAVAWQNSRMTFV